MEKLSQGERGGSGGGGGAAGDQGLSADAVVYRNKLRCKVCETQQKEAVIVKCGHLFCQGCIKANLDTRHRKCPACGTPFGQGDVRTIYF